jgi:hypothetical protein
MKHMGGRDWELWSETDGFFYDVLRYPDGSFHKFRVRSLVGLIPLFAVEVLAEEVLADLPEFGANFEWFLRNRPGLTGRCVQTLEHGSTPAGRSSSRTRTGGTACCSTSTSTATPGRGSAPPTRRAGPGWSPR